MLLCFFNYFPHFEILTSVCSYWISRDIFLIRGWIEIDLLWKITIDQSSLKNSVLNLLCWLLLWETCLAKGGFLLAALAGVDLTRRSWSRVVWPAVLFLEFRSTCTKNACSALLRIRFLDFWKNILFLICRNKS